MSPHLFKPHFTSPLEVRFLRGRKWELTRGIVYAFEKNDGITVPKGFVTDFASLPRVLWSLIPPTGQHAPAAVLHDYLYKTGRFTRAASDRFFLDAMKASGVSWTRRWMMYRGVRAGGGRAWRAHRKAEKTYFIQENDNTKQED